MTSNIRFNNPPELSKPPGYTHVVEITGPARIPLMDKALEMAPERQLLLSYCALILEALRRKPEAIAACSKFLSSPPKPQERLQIERCRELIKRLS